MSVGLRYGYKLKGAPGYWSIGMGKIEKISLKQRQADIEKVASVDLYHWLDVGVTAFDFTVDVDPKLVELFVSADVELPVWLKYRSPLILDTSLHFNTLSNWKISFPRVQNLNFDYFAQRWARQDNPSLFHSEVVFVYFLKVYAYVSALRGYMHG